MQGRRTTLRHFNGALARLARVMLSKTVMIKTANAIVFDINDNETPFNCKRPNTDFRVRNRAEYGWFACMKLRLLFLVILSPKHVPGEAGDECRSTLQAYKFANVEHVVLKLTRELPPLRSYQIKYEVLQVDPYQ